MRVHLSRRRPVPREWREGHHELDVRAYRGYHIRGGGYTSRASGTCSCGVGFGKAAEPPRHDMNAADVREAWLDHVEQEFYKQADEATT